MNVGAALVPCSLDPTGQLHMASLRPLRSGYRPPLTEYGLNTGSQGFVFNASGGIKGNGESHHILMISQESDTTGVPIPGSKVSLSPEYVPGSTSNLGG